MSHSAAPCGAMVGVMPLNVIGPPWMMVIVPVAKRVTSPLDVATTVRLAGVLVAPAGVAAVGIVVGAVYVAVVNPVDVMLPQVGLHVAKLGSGIVVVAVDCVTNQLTPWLCRSFVSC